MTLLERCSGKIAVGANAVNTFMATCIKLSYSMKLSRWQSSHITLDTRREMKI